MKGLLGGLTMCLLVSLLLMTVADGAGRGYPHLSMSLGSAVAELWDRERTFAATRSGRTSWFRIRAGEDKCEFMLGKWWRRSTHRQIWGARFDRGGRFLRQGGDADILGIGFQGSISSRE